jgi:hypothetical protein
MDFGDLRKLEERVRGISQGHSMNTFRFGKHPAKHDYRTLRFKDYVTKQLAAPPSSYDALVRVYANLGSSDTSTLFPMDGNDTLGDCTIAGLAHAETVFRALVKEERIPPRKQVVRLYWHLTGGVDSGLNELDVLNYWRKNRFAGDELVAFASVDPKNHAHVQQAIYLFGGVYLGFQVQEACLDDFNAKRPWAPGPLTKEGHAVVATGYDSEGVTVLTWGSTQRGTWDWWDECVDEAYALLPPEAFDMEFAGLDIDQLKDDLAEVAEDVVGVAEGAMA